MNHRNAVVHNLGRVIFYCDPLCLYRNFLHKSSKKRTNRHRVVCVEHHAANRFCGLGDIGLIDIQFGVCLRFQGNDALLERFHLGLDFTQAHGDIRQVRRVLAVQLQDAEKVAASLFSITNLGHDGLTFCFAVFPPISGCLFNFGNDG
ncbi:MAG: hypothetical protein ACOH2S_20200 [Janthinobacterium svalbardensis]